MSTETKKEQFATASKPPVLTKTIPPTQTMSGTDVHIPLDRIQLTGWNPRKRLDPAKLQELADSIKAQGVLQAIYSRKNDAQWERAKREIAADKTGRRKILAPNQGVFYSGGSVDSSSCGLADLNDCCRADVSPGERKQRKEAAEKAALDRKVLEWVLLRLNDILSKNPLSPTPRVRRPKTELGKRQCPRCGRIITTVEGKLINHREGTDKRGYANGAWCDYSEVGANGRDKP